MAEKRIQYADGGVTFEAKGPVVIEVAQKTLGAVEVRVQDDARKKLGGAQVDLSGPLSLGDATAKDGTVRFDRLPPGEYTLDVSHPGFQRSGQKVQVKAPANDTATTTAGVATADAGAPDATVGGATTVDVDLVPGTGKLEVTVKDADGNPVPNASVRAVGVGPGNIFVGAADGSGKGQLFNLTPGDYEVFAEASGLSFASIKGVKIAAGANVVTITASVPPDIAIDARTALLFCASGPQAAGSTAANDDRRATWVHVPDGAPLTPADLYVYFHGFDNFVNVKPGSTPGGDAKVPNWIRADRRTEATGTVASGVKYKLATVYTASAHKPIMIAAEDGIADALTGAQAATIRAANAAEQARFKRESEAFEARGRTPPKPAPARITSIFYARTSAGTLRGAPAALTAFLQESLGRLHRLKNGGTPYLATAIDLSRDRLRRLYLSGHSGGGVPLTACAASDLARDLPCDLWVLDATYGTGQPEYIDFCREKAKKGALGTGAAQSRFVAISMEKNKSGTENHLNDIVKDLAKAPELVSAGIAPVSTTYAGPADDAKLRTDLRNPIVIVKTAIEHDKIPATFLPFLFETAA